MIELFASAFATLFVVIDPPGCAPIYAGLVADADRAAVRSMAIRATVIATLILLGFGLFGEALLSSLHIDLDSFRIAGGLMLFLIALEMVFEKRQQRREDRADRIRAGGPEFDDVSVFPMAMPMLAGPGSIATIMLLVARADGIEDTITVFAALLSVMAISLVALLTARPLMRVLGARVEAIVTRLLGVLLAALAVQFVVNGLRGSFGLA